MKKLLLSPLAFVAFAVVVLFGAYFAPHETANVLAVIGVVSVATFFVANTSRQSRRNALVPALNSLPANVGSSKSPRRFLASGAIAFKYKLVKKGADSEHAAAVAAASDEVIGAAVDDVAAAEDPVSVELFGICTRTLPLTAAAAIAVDADVYSDGTGKVTVKPTAAGTYWKVGKARTAAGADGDPIEVMPIKPRRLTVIAALGNTNSEISALSSSANTTQAEFNALRDKCEELADDLRAIAAALDADGDVALATT